MCFFGRKKLLKKQEELTKAVETLTRSLQEMSGGNNQLKNDIAMMIQLSNTTLTGGINANLKAVTDTVNLITQNNERNIAEIKQQVSKELTEVRNDNEKNIAEIKQQVSKELTEVRNDNDKQLTAMRAVVEEKLTATIGERLSGTVSTINQRLDSLNKGLGELQSLSGGVNDLKKVLTNVKTRGVWGEVSLARLLESVLTPDQYVSQYNVTGRRRGDDSGLVDFAIVLPGQEKGEQVYLPIDSKFPVEDYQRLVEASEKGDAEGVQTYSKALAFAVKKQARSIRDSYVEPPKTTDFAILYLPTEGLYAEVVRMPGLVEEMQNSLKVVPAGPTTLTGLINSLQLGFKTLAVQRSSKQVFDMLTKIRNDFHTFVEQIGKVQGHIDGANKTLQDAAKRSEMIISKLDKVDTLSLPEANP